MAELLDGRPVAATIAAALQDMVGERAATGRPQPRLAIIMVGDDASSSSYAQTKFRLCERVGVGCDIHRFPASISENELGNHVALLAADPRVHGVLVELPLPRGLSTVEVFRRIPLHKDIEGMNLESVGRLAQGNPCFVPATPAAVIRLLDHHGVEIQGREVVIVGRSRVVGRPLASLLLTRNATVTVCHSFTDNLAAHTRRADILVVAIGQAGFIQAQHVKPGAVVVDVGTNYEGGRLRGDVDFDAVRPVAGWISPVPGGVGQVTTALMVQSVIRAADMQETQRQEPLLLGEAQ